SLKANRGVNAGYQLVRRLLLRLDTFGFHLATLELKQRADVLHRVLAQGMDEPDWVKLPRDERTRRLGDILRRNVGPVAPLDALSRRTLAVFEAAMQCRMRYGQKAIGDYVVAATVGADDILAALVVARWAGVDDRTSGAVGLDFSPLCESGASLDAARATRASLLADPVYRELLRARGMPQPVYVGCAEAGRDGGYLAMRVSAYEAQ